MKKSHTHTKLIFLIIVGLILAGYGFSSMPQGSNEAGWYFVREESIMSDLDYSISGKHENFSGGFRHYDIQQGSFSGSSLSISFRRENPDGSLATTGDSPAKGSVTISWSTPPKFIAEGEQASIQITRSVGEHSWNIGFMSVGFFEADVRPGSSTRGAPRFKTSAGENIPGESFSGTVTMEFGAPRGRYEGQEYAVLISSKGGYGYRYVYEWREGPQPDAVAVIPQPGPGDNGQPGSGGSWVVPIMIIGGLGVIAVVGVVGVGGAVTIGIKILGGGGAAAATAAGSGVTAPSASQSGPYQQSSLGQNLPTDFIQESQFGSPSDNPNIEYQSQKDQCRPY